MTAPDAGRAAAGDAAEITRQSLHTRTIRMEGFSRSDGLFELQARLTDSKPFEFRPPSDVRVVKPGQLIHDLRVTIVFDEEMVVRDVLAFTDAIPYADCANTPGTLKTMIGLRLNKGWAAEVRQRLSGDASCNHMAGLMVPMAAAAMQALYGARPQGREALSPEGKPLKIGSCFAYAPSGQIVQRLWPAFHVAKPATGEAAATPASSSSTQAPRR